MAPSSPCSGRRGHAPRPQERSCSRWLCGAPRHAREAAGRARLASVLISLQRFAAGDLINDALSAGGAVLPGAQFSSLEVTATRPAPGRTYACDGGAAVAPRPSSRGVKARCGEVLHRSVSASARRAVAGRAPSVRAPADTSQGTSVRVVTAPPSRILVSRHRVSNRSRLCTDLLRLRWGYGAVPSNVRATRSTRAPASRISELHACHERVPAATPSFLVANFIIRGVEVRVFGARFGAGPRFSARSGPAAYNPRAPPVKVFRIGPRRAGRAAPARRAAPSP
jgi:hypothetical protein